MTTTSSPKASSSSPVKSSKSALLSLPTYTSASSSRLQSLYSDFSRQKHSNPASYNANVEWWRRTLEGAVWEGVAASEPSNARPNVAGGGSGNRLVLNAGRSLVDNLKVEGVGKPIGLGAVVTELLLPPPSSSSSSSSSSNTPTLLPLALFLSSPTSIYASSSRSLPLLLASYLVAKPLWWALEQLGITGEEGLLRSSTSGASINSSRNIAWHGEYVMVSLLERAAEGVSAERRAAVGGLAESLFTFEGFARAFAGCVGNGDSGEMSETDAKVLVRYLERDKGMVIVDEDEDIIKFIDNVPLQSRIITPVDTGLLELKTAVDNLHEQVDGIQKQIDGSTEKASAALKAKRKPLALSYLRSRKQLEDLLAKRLGSLDTLEGTLLRVEAAAGDIDIISAYESSTTTLRTILSHPSLQRDSIERTMEALAEANADSQEVDEAIRVGGDVAMGIPAGDADVEDELAELIAEAERDKEREKREREDWATKDKLDGVGRVPAGVGKAEEREREKEMVLN